MSLCCKTLKLKGQIINLVIKNFPVGTDTGTAHRTFSPPGQYSHGCVWGLIRSVGRQLVQRYFGCAHPKMASGGHSQEPAVQTETVPQSQDHFPKPCLGASGQMVK